jgi:AcrR family transcriptional regulator
MTSDTKQRIIEHAGRLFFKEGFSTGVDRVISESKVAKMSLYKHFKTKEGLICAILDESRSMLENHIRVEMALNKKPPLAQLEAASLILYQAMNDPDARLGLAVRALIGFPGPRNVVHEKARQIDLAVLKLFERLAEEASLLDPKQTAREILQIANGHFLMTAVIGSDFAEAATAGLLGAVLAQAPVVPESRKPEKPTRRHQAQPTNSNQ